jgi:hypothetical protein
MKFGLVMWHRSLPFGEEPSKAKLGTKFGRVRSESRIANRTLKSATPLQLNRIDTAWPIKIILKTL